MLWEGVWEIFEIYHHLMFLDEVGAVEELVDFQRMEGFLYFVRQS